jgi:two-component system nitrogen regulation sensor histidine kinase NtrY
VLRNRLIAAFILATVPPLMATIWIATSLLDRSLGYATTEEIDELSRTLEGTVRQFYQREREALRHEALAGRIAAETYGVADISAWPDPVRAFWESGERERFGLSGSGGNHVDYMRRDTHGVDVYSRGLGGIRMEELSTNLRETRQLVDSIEARDLRRGFTLTLLLLVAAVWIVSLAPVIFVAHRISRPIQQLTAALTAFAAGNLDGRVELPRQGLEARGMAGPGRGAAWGRWHTANERDEVGQAVRAFNHMAEQIRQSRDRLVYLTQMSSWQSLARKTAHELKNSLTPIRLTMEEILARHPPADRAFMDAAAEIVVSEIDSLERRVRAFSEFSSEPPVNAEMLDVNALVGERVSLLRRAHPEIAYELRLDASAPRAHADADLVRGILTNLLENAAEAAGHQGTVLTVTRTHEERVLIEVHDSGPGITEESQGTLFEPTISFKKHGMGLGLSIAKKNALLSGGDIALIDSELGGAGFRVVLPVPSKST